MSCVLCKNEEISGTLKIPPYTLNICNGCGIFTLFPYGSSSGEVRHDDDIDPPNQSLYEMKKGGFHMAINTGISIIPVGVLNVAIVL